MSIAQPTWDIVELFPEQGSWTEQEYMRLPGNRLIEFSDGRIEVLPMPSRRHQKIIMLLSRLLEVFVTSYNLGQVLIAPFKIRLWPEKVREPDIMFMLNTNLHRCFEQYWESADLVMEVISPDDPERDTVRKKAEYAQAGIKEYWIINPINETIVVLTLEGGSQQYREAAVYSNKDKVKSVLLEGFSVDTAQVFSV